MKRWHATGHECCPVRHADGGSYIKLVEPRSFGSKSVDIRRPDNRISIAPEMISAVLVGNNEEYVFLGAHLEKLWEGRFASQFRHCDKARGRDCMQAAGNAL